MKIARIIFEILTVALLAAFLYRLQDIRNERDGYKSDAYKLSQVYRGHLSRGYMKTLCGVDTSIGVPKPTEKEQACIDGASQRAREEVESVTKK